MQPAEPTTSQGAAPPRWLHAAAAWSWRLLVVAGAVYVAVLALASLRVVVLPIIIALLLTSLLLPLVRVLRRRKVPDAAAAGIVLLGGIALIATVIALILPSMIHQFSELGTQVREGIDKVGTVLADPPFNLSKADIQDRIDQGIKSLRKNSGSIGSGVVSGAVVLGEFLTGLIITLLLTFFFLKDGDRMWRWAVSLAGDRRSDHVHEIALRSFTALAGYVRGIAMVGLVDSVLVGIALLVIGVPLVIPLMVLTFIGAFLPLVGAFSAGLAAVLIALVSNGLVPALIVLGVYVGVQQLEGHLLYPVLMSRAVNLHPAVIIVALASGGILAGVIGIFLAVPVASVVSVTLDYARDRPPPESPLTGPPEEELAPPVTDPSG
ncbi:MAG: AI-2E family transporter [Actinomycetota bacterium]|nr:AI-2E family transporter [Actinomycetota bacterium]